jgi:hypothetical protein
MHPCLFCGGDASAPDHLAHCDGRQGAIEADPVLAARAGDPDTSHEAMAAYDRARMRSAMAVVVRLHRRLGPLADFQLKEAFAAAWAGKCCDHLYQQARSAARDAGLICDTGERLVNPTTNRRQVVWAAADGAPITVPRCPTCGAVRRRRHEAAA